MDREFVSDIAFTPQVKAEQEKRGSRIGYAKMEQKGGWRDRVTEDLTEYLSARDSFYLATASADGQPYIQHRGGKPGFLKVLDDRRLAFADFAGNRQYISIGNAAENPKAFILRGGLITAATPMIGPWILLFAAGLFVLFTVFVQQVSSSGFSLLQDEEKRLNLMGDEAVSKAKRNAEYLVMIPFVFSVTSLPTKSAIF